MTPLVTNTQTRVSIDWDDDRFICKDADKDDPVNILPNALNYSGLEHGIPSEYTSITPSVNSGIYNTRGKVVFTIVLSSAVNSGFRLGADETDNDGEIPISASTTYTVSFWTRGTVGYSGVPFRLEMYDESGNSFGVHVDADITGEWVRWTLTFTTGGSSTHAALRFYKNNDATVMTMEVSGVMVTAGSVAPSGYNVGGLSLYDDLTEWTLGWNTRSGATKPEKYIASEGDLELILTNVDRRFSPAYSGSFLFQNFWPGVTVDVEVRPHYDYDNDWTRIWAGTVRNILPTPMGKKGNLQAVISAEQGMFKIDDTKHPNGLLSNVSADDIILHLLGGTFTAPTQAAFVVGKSAIGLDTVVGGGSLVMSPGDWNYEVYGEAWDDEEESSDKRKRANIPKILGELGYLEQGFIWLDRDGNLHFKSGSDFLLAHTESSYLSLDTHSLKNKYEFGAEAGLYSEVAITYHEIAEATGPIWEDTMAYTIASAATLVLSCVFREGTAKATPETVSDIEANVSATPDTVSTKFSNFSTEGVTLTIENTGGSSIVVSGIAINATAVANSDDGKTITIRDDDAVIHYGVRTIEEDFKLLKSADQASNLASKLLDKFSTPRGRFTKIHLIDKDTEWLDLMLSDLHIGSLWFMTEYQTGETDKPTMIIGEAFSWRPGEFTGQFSVKEADGGVYWILETSLLEVGTIVY